MRKPAKMPGPTDGQIYRRALGIGLLGVAAVAISVGLTAGPSGKAAAFFRSFVPPPKPAAARAATAPTHLFPEPLTAELRKKGFHECFPHDPVGLGPYAPFKNLSLGRIAIPQRGGHTEDMGYDVVIHFHGQSPVRKTLAQVARGVTFVGIDRGLGSGAYSDAFPNPDVFAGLVRSIEATLKKQSGDDRAHVRHLALSAWSAGYGAINEILKFGDSRIDAVILLDGLHAGWNPSARSHDAGVSALSSLPISPTFRFAKKALAGEKIFVFTHTEIIPEGYPSTRQTADLLLSELGVTRTAVDPGEERFGRTGAVDAAGLHVWSYGGANEAAHCAHIPLITHALHIIEDAWDTPPLDRSVPFTPAPVLGAPDGGSDGISVELVPAVELEPPPNTLAAALAPAEAVDELLPQPAPAADLAEPPPAEPAAPTEPALEPPPRLEEGP